MDRGPLDPGAPGRGPIDADAAVGTGIDPVDAGLAGTQGDAFDAGPVLRPAVGAVTAPSAVVHARCAALAVGHCSPQKTGTRARLYLGRRAGAVDLTELYVFRVPGGSGCRLKACRRAGRHTCTGGHEPN